MGAKGFVEAYQQSASFTHSYSVAGVYTVQFMVKDNAGNTATSSISVNVGNSTQPSITVTSPNGGEQWQIGKTYYISWYIFGATDGFRIASIGFLKKGDVKYSKIIYPNIAANVGKYNLTITSDIAPGDYQIGIDLINSNKEVVSTDYSNNYFTISQSSIATCTDSDNSDSDGTYLSGTDIYTKGIVNYNDPFSVSYPNGTITDYCYNSTSLAEYRCHKIDNNSFEDMNLVACLNGCENGACKQSTQKSVTATFLSGQAQVSNNGSPGDDIAIGIIKVRLKPTGGTLTDLAGSPYSYVINAYDSSDNKITSLSGSSTISSSPNGNISSGSSVDITVSQAIQTKGSSFSGGMVRFKLEKLNWKIGDYNGTSLGDGYWVTPYVYLPAAQTLAFTSVVTDRTSYAQGATISVQWKGPVNRALVDLLDSNGNYIKNLGQLSVAGLNYTWSIPSTFTPGSYKIRITLDNATIKDGFSNVFSIVSQTTNSCTDSDSGKNYFVKGITSDTFHKTESPTSDFCSGNYLYEYYCPSSTSSWNFNYYLCPNGCENGACKQATSSATLSYALSSDTPQSANFYLDSVSGQKNIPFTKFTVKAVGGDIKLASINAVTSMVDYNKTQYGNFYLYDGDTLIASATISDGTFVNFRNFQIFIPSGVTKVLTLKGDVLANLANGAWTSVEIREVGGYTTSNVMKYTQGSVFGNKMFFYRQGAQFTFLSGTATVTNNGSAGNDAATGSLKIKIAPFGGSMIAPRNASGSNGISTIVINAYDSNGNLISNGAVRTIVMVPNNSTIYDGTTAEITVNEVVTNVGSNSADRQVRFKIDGINWQVGSQTSYTPGESTWVTPYVLLPASRTTQQSVTATFLSGTAVVQNNGINGDDSATGTLKLRLTPSGGTLTDLAKSHSSYVINAYDSSGNKITNLSGATSITSNSTGTVPSGSTEDITVTQTIRTGGSSFLGGMVRFKLEQLNWTMGNQTGTIPGDPNWVTPYVYLPVSQAVQMGSNKNLGDNNLASMMATLNWLSEQIKLLTGR
jgi:hypothetical protein